LQKFESIVNEASSPKGMHQIGRSIEKKIFTHEKSDKKFQPKILNSTQNMQNMSLKNI